MIQARKICENVRTETLSLDICAYCVLASWLANLCYTSNLGDRI
jgi:hypothetical protein